MRIQDLATLIKLTQGQFYEDWSNLVRLEDRLDFCKDLMMRKNPPHKLRSTVNFLNKRI